MERTGTARAAVALFLVTVLGPTTAGETAPASADGSLRLTLEVRKEPRPLRIHVLEVDLSSGRWEVAAAVADDPDGAGPAEALLEEPRALAARKGLAAAVNANAFAGLPDAAGKRDSNWFAGKFVEILGSAVEDGAVRSGPQEGYDDVRVEDGAVRGGPARAAADPRAAVAGFRTVLSDGKAVGQDDALHPRTAAGWDAGGKRLWLAVIDGRQAGRSEGMTTREVGELMKSLGCLHAVNLDGGGSSVLLLSREGRPLEIVNRPSGGATRPVPVLLGIRERKG